MQILQRIQNIYALVRAVPTHVIELLYTRKIRRVAYEGLQNRGAVLNDRPVLVKVKECSLIRSIAVEYARVDDDQLSCCTVYHRMEIRTVSHCVRFGDLHRAVHVSGDRAVSDGRDFIYFYLTNVQATLDRHRLLCGNVADQSARQRHNVFCVVWIWCGEFCCIYSTGVQTVLHNAVGKHNAHQTAGIARGQRIAGIGHLSVKPAVVHQDTAVTGDLTDDTAEVDIRAADDGVTVDRIEVAASATSDTAGALSAKLIVAV